MLSGIAEGHAFKSRSGSKFTQAQEAILDFRKAHGITSVLHRSGAASAPPFHSLDKMVYWQKSIATG